jgi:hypothetical protein
MAVLLRNGKGIPQLPAEGAQDRIDKRGLGIGLVQAFRAITHVPHDLKGAGDLAFEALLDGNGERHEGGLSYRRLRSRDSAPARIPSKMSGVSGASRRIRLTDGFLSPSASETPVTGSC